MFVYVYRASRTLMGTKESGYSEGELCLIVFKGIVPRLDVLGFAISPVKKSVLSPSISLLIGEEKSMVTCSLNLFFCSFFSSFSMLIHYFEDNRRRRRR